MPAIERGAQIPADGGIARVMSAHERAAAFAEGFVETQDTSVPSNLRAWRGALVIYGINPVLEALKARRVTRLRVTARPGDNVRRLDEIVALASKQGVAVERVEPPALDRAARGGVHQGVDRRHRAAGRCQHRTAGDDGWHHG